MDIVTFVTYAKALRHVQVLLGRAVAEREFDRAVVGRFTWVP